MQKNSMLRLRCWTWHNVRSMPTAQDHEWTFKCFRMRRYKNAQTGKRCKNSCNRRYTACGRCFKPHGALSSIEREIVRHLSEPEFERCGERARQMQFLGVRNPHSTDIARNDRPVYTDKKLELPMEVRHCCLALLCCNCGLLQPRCKLSANWLVM